MKRQNDVVVVTGIGSVQSKGGVYMKNRLKELMSSGKIVLGAQLRFGTPAVAELFAVAGFDFLVFDTEHAPQTPVGVQAQIQAMSGTDVTPIVRPAKNDPDLMRPYLDMGALGFLVPFVKTGDEARLGARALRYPPEGTRGAGPSRAYRYGFDKFDGNYMQRANENMVFMPIIEDAEAVSNIDDIFAAEGVDTFIIGVWDLSISLGVPMDLEHPKMKDARKSIINAAQKSGTPLGTAIYGGDMFNPDTYKRFLDEGFKLLLVGGDEWMLNHGCTRLLETVDSLRR